MLEKGIGGANIYIISDNQAAILALYSKRVGSSMVADCCNCLHRLSKKNKVALHWVPGQFGFYANELADELVRAGSWAALHAPSPSTAVVNPS